MQQSTLNQTMLGSPVIDKPSLANRYLVGIRTIENWLARKIICGQIENGKVVFDPGECDRRLFAFGGHTVQSKSNRFP